MDYSELMISAAKKLQDGGTINCDNDKIHLATMTDINPNRVQFVQVIWSNNGS